MLILFHCVVYHYVKLNINIFGLFSSEILIIGKVALKNCIRFDFITKRIIINCIKERINLFIFRYLIINSSAFKTGESIIILI